MGQRTENIFERGQAFLEKNDFEQALRLFNQVLNREPGHNKALRNKALIKITENADDTEEFLLFAIKQHPDDDQLHQMMGSYYQGKNEHEKAIEAFKKALDSNAENALAHMGLSLINAQVLDKHKEAIQHYSKAEELGMESPDLYFNRGCSHMILGEMERAEEDFEKAKESGHEEARKFLTQYF